MNPIYFALWFILVALYVCHADASEKGKKIYVSNCIQCHNRNPSIKGPIGPELTDTPLEVMKIKVTTGKYPKKLPKGYTPKMKSQIMRAFPYLEKNVSDLFSYIQSFKKK